MSTQINTPRDVSPDPTTVSVAVATVLVGLSAGFFHAYESSVTRGMAMVSDLAYVQSMNAVNLSVRNAIFGIAFFGGLLSVVVALFVNLARARNLRTTLVAVGAALYLATVAITASTNVPLNEELARGVAADADPAALRADYEQQWNAANRLRTMTSAGALTALVAALASAPTTVRRAPAMTATGVGQQ